MSLQFSSVQSGNDSKCGVKFSSVHRVLRVYIQFSGETRKTDGWDPVAGRVEVRERAYVVLFRGRESKGIYSG